MSYKAMLCFRLFCMCLTIQCLHDMTSGVEIRALCKTPTNLSQKPWQKHVLLHAQGYWHPETGLFILVLEIVMLQYAIIQLCTSIFGKMGCCFFFSKVWEHSWSPHKYSRSDFHLLLPRQCTTEYTKPHFTFLQIYISLIFLIHSHSHSVVVDTKPLGSREP